MKTRDFVKCGAIALAVLCATAFQALAQAPGGAGGRGGMGILTQEQRTKMREAIQGDLMPLVEKLAAAQKEVVKAAMAENASEDAVRAKVEAVNKVQTEIAMLRLKGFKAIASSLTADQKAQLAEARDGGYMALFGGFGGGRGGRGGRGGGAGGAAGGGGGVVR